MKLLTFLGVARYDTTTYHWRGNEYTTRFAPDASCHFLKPESITVFLTEEAESQVFPELRLSLPEDMAVQPVPVALGRDETELWQIFEQVSAAVNPGETVAFDITHGLRSFPLVGLLAAAFLRSGLDVNLAAVLYGAYDVRDQSTTPSRTPMFDLSPMLALLEWAAAADRFNRTGDSRYLASLVTAQRKHLAHMARGEHALLDEVGALGNLAGALGSISQGLELLRPRQVMQAVSILPDQIQKSQPALQRSAPSRPFSILLDSIYRTYQPLSVPELGQGDRIQQELAVERRMIHWYAEREHWMQAVSLAREWLLSWVMVQLGLYSITQLSTRERIQQVLGAEADELVRSKKNGPPFNPVFLGQLPMADKVLGFWPQITKVRNDIDHAGMREEPGEPESLIKQIKDIVKFLDLLPLSA